MEYGLTLGTSMSKNPYIDITAAIHGGNKQSQDANIKIAPYKTNWQEKVLGLMALRDEQGLGTSRRHAADYFGKEAGQISGRFTELKVAGLIEETGVVENGFMVYRLPRSVKVAVKVYKRLSVKGAGLTGEIMFEKTTGGWQIAAITPNLKSIIGETPVEGIKPLLLQRGFTYSWPD